MRIDKKRIFYGQNKTNTPPKKADKKKHRTQNADSQVNGTRNPKDASSSRAPRDQGSRDEKQTIG
ncbi:MAG: hypothetical protein J4215_03740 [Candidatus Diapherotrites archaeon]|uniref:Uncharacterized protein n=1 Tax=Candidatus Iainarchaeum sp. TaxID=3101447 RepID=A0A8T4L512_9ARCH|nr:hypothetical protein [Candidatus Diapherotrites archaeon]